MIKHFGSVANTASALGISNKAVYQWGESPPEGRQFQIELLTSGLFKAANRSVSPLNSADTHPPVSA